MAQIKINSGSGGNNGKIKIGNNKSSGKNVQLNIGKNNEPDIEEEVAPTPPPNTGMPAPVQSSFDSEPVEPLEQTNYEVKDDIDDIIDDEEENENSGKKRRGKGKGKKAKGKKGKKEKKPKDNKPDTVEARYKAYRTRKYIVIVSLVVIALALVFFGVYNTFFKATLSKEEAASYTNSVNGQTQVQQWDSGVEGYLQTNLQKIIESNAILNGDNKDFTVTNIAVEKNLQLSSDSLITFFSADITLHNETTRTFFELPLKIVDGKFVQAGVLSMTFREPFASDGATIAENEFLDFGENPPVDEAVTAEFENVLENFLTLAYNEKQDVSNIYKGEAPLSFTGKCLGITKCEVYSEDNELGYNCIAIYKVELPNGFQYKTQNYMKVEKSGDSYIISKIL